jgi:D-cysteine desulfhydrase
VSGEDPTDLALFRAFPGLRDRLPRRPFVLAPTPVEPLPLPGLPRGQLFVKRDERSSPLVGGNKPRKLEFWIGRALATGARTLVTTGGLGTNHGLATTILGRAAGLATVLVLVHQPPTAAVRRTLCLQQAYGAELVYGGSVAGAACALLAVLVRERWRGRRPLWIPTGGSSALGDVGFVSAGLELAEQVRAGALPEPSRLFVSVGSGGTLAGLVVGLRLAGLRTRVAGVLVSDILPPSRRRLARAARATLRGLRRLDPTLPELRLEPADFDLLRGHVGPSYGSATPEAHAARDAAAALGLELDLTYSAKCLAAIRAEALAGTLGAGPVLFWNTFNAVDLAAAAPRALAEPELPARVRRALAAGAGRRRVGHRHGPTR